MQKKGKELSNWREIERNWKGKPRRRRNELSKRKKQLVFFVQCLNVKSGWQTVASLQLGNGSGKEVLSLRSQKATDMA